MKVNLKISILLIIALFFVVLLENQSAGAQSTGWDDCNGGLCYASGNIGVNTLTPGTKLEVNGHIKSVANSGGATYVITPNGGGQSFGMTTIGGVFYLGRTAGPGQGIQTGHIRIYSNGDMCLGSTCN
jgi:hypothetical protein